jgi:hypothetical protein
VKIKADNPVIDALITRTAKALTVVVRRMLLVIVVRFRASIYFVLMAKYAHVQSDTAIRRIVVDRAAMPSQAASAMVSGITVMMDWIVMQVVLIG